MSLISTNLLKKYIPSYPAIYSLTTLPKNSTSKTSKQFTGHTPQELPTTLNVPDFDPIPPEKPSNPPPLSPDPSPEFPGPTKPDPEIQPQPGPDMPVPPNTTPGGPEFPVPPNPTPEWTPPNPPDVEKQHPAPPEIQLPYA